MNLFSKPKIYTYLKNFDFRTQWICSTSKILQRRRIFILHSIRATKIPIRKEEKIQCEKISEWPFWSFLRNTLLSALFYKKAISLWRTLCCRSWSCLLAFFFKRNNGLFQTFLGNTPLSALFYNAISLQTTLCGKSWSCLLAFLKK